MMAWLNSVVSTITGGVWSVIVAALILVVAIVVASIVKSFVLKILDKGKIKDALSKIDEVDGKPGGSKEFIGKLIYLLVFLLFVPSIFAALGMEEVTAPITSILNKVWGYVPNVVAAVIVLIVGFLVAKLVRQLLIPVFDKIQIDKFQEKAGIEVTGTAKLSSTLAYIVYVLILIPMIVMALQVLNINVISEPAIRMLDVIFAFIPNILVGLVIIVIGCIIAKFISQIVTRLIASAGLDAKVAKLVNNDKQKVVLSRFAGVAVQTIVIIFFVVQGLNVLNLKVLTDIGEVIIAYIPAVLSAVVILAIGFLTSTAAEKTLKKNGFDAYAVVAKVVILVIAAFMILSQLGIAAEIVNTTFKLVVAALAVAFAIAFGVGGRDFAARMLNKLEDKAEEKKED